MQHMQRGFSLLPLVIIIGFVVAGGAGYYVWEEKHAWKPIETPSGAHFQPQTNVQTGAGKPDMSSMISISPAVGRVGTIVSISVTKGAGFAPTGNSIHVGKGCIENVSAVNATLITFVMPARVNECHDSASKNTDTQPVTLEPGTMPAISVSNENGAVTNSVTFTLAMNTGFSVSDMVGTSPHSVMFTREFSQDREAPYVHFGDGSETLQMSCGRSDCTVAHTYALDSEHYPSGVATFNALLLTKTATGEMVVEDSIPITILK